MPLRDHFHPPLSNQFSWEEVHGGWPMVIVQQLGRILPAQYVAAPRVHFGPQIEIDVVTFNKGSSFGQNRFDVEDNGLTATLWAPSKPSLQIETKLADFDEYEVRIYDLKA